MKVLSRKEPKAESLEELSEEQIRERMKQARREFGRLSKADPAELARLRRVDEATAKLQRQVDTIVAGEAELQRRAVEELEQRADAAVLRSGSRRAALEEADAHEAVKERRRPVLAALQAASRFRHPELEGETLVSDRLSDGEGADLRELVRRKLSHAFGDVGSEPLDEGGAREYERLIGLAAGDPELFTRKRAETGAKAKVRQQAKALRRHPQAESLVAAVFADPGLWDLVHERLREDMTLIDERGRQSQTTAVERILEPEHVAALFLVVSLIVEAGGGEIRLTQHGAVRGNAEAGRLPFIDPKLLAQLRRNRFITTLRQGSEIVVGPGERVREIAERWELSLPDSTA